MSLFKKIFKIFTFSRIELSSLVSTLLHIFTFKADVK